MKYFLLLTAFFTAYLSSGCANTPAKYSDAPVSYQLPHRTIAILEKKFEGYVKSPNQNQFLNIENGYLDILKQSPDYVPAMSGLYSLYYFETQSSIGVNIQRTLLDNKLDQIFWRLPSLIRQQFYPPVFAQYQRNLALGNNQGNHLSGQLFEEAQLKRLLKAVAQSPRNPAIRVIMAEQLLAMNHERTGILLIKEAWQAQPSEDIYPHALGNLQYREALGSDCPQDQTDTLTPALNYYRKALTLNPDANVHYEMGIIYGLLRLKPLMINEANVLAKKDDLNSYWQSAYLYIHADQLEKAKDVFQKANALANLKVFPQSRAYVDFLMLNGDWSRAADYYRHYLNVKQNLTSYDLLISSLIWSQLIEQNSKLKLADVWPANRKVTERYSWPDTLMEVLFGEKNYDVISSDLKETRCKQVQLSFYAGLKARADNDSQQANKHANTIKEARMPFSFESLLSKKLL